MSKAIDEMFAASRANRRPLLVAYVMAGDPGVDASVAVAVACARAGAGMLEIGVPFSDPIADGPTIAKAGARALGRGVTLRAALDVARRVRRECSVPIVLMGYANPFFHYGPKRLVADAVSAGVDGLLIPDLPFDHSGALGVEMRAHRLAAPQLIAPTSTAARMGEVARGASGFLYYVSVTGVTGTTEPDLTEVESGVGRARAETDLPIVVGFGIREPAQLARMRHLADGFVVGSAIVERAARSADIDTVVSDISQFVRSLDIALHS